MQWSDTAIILSARRLGESSGVVHLLSREHGMYAGVDKGAFSGRKRGLYQQGNIVAAHWQARLSEHLGMLTCELTHATAAHLLDDRRKLAALTSATLMTEKMLSEREAQPMVYACMEALVQALCHGGDWRAEYVRLEFTLLACSGFGLDLERCAATGQADDLLYVSPKSGRAVSRGAGEPYRERLLRLPAFLLYYSPLAGESQSRAAALAQADDAVGGGLMNTPHPGPPLQGGREEIAMAQILDGLRLCGYFLEVRVFAPRGLPLPAVRARFVKVLQPEELTIGETAHQAG